MVGLTGQLLRCSAPPEDAVTPKGFRGPELSPKETRCFLSLRTQRALDPQLAPAVFGSVDGAAPDAMSGRLKVLPVDKEQAEDQSQSLRLCTKDSSARPTLSLPCALRRSTCKTNWSCPTVTAPQVTPLHEANIAHEILVNSSIQFSSRVRVTCVRSGRAWRALPQTTSDTYFPARMADASQGSNS